MKFSTLLFVLGVALGATAYYVGMEQLHDHDRAFMFAALMAVLPITFGLLERTQPDTSQDEGRGLAVDVYIADPAVENKHHIQLTLQGFEWYGHTHDELHIAIHRELPADTRYLAYVQGSWASSDKLAREALVRVQGAAA